MLFQDLSDDRLPGIGHMELMGSKGMPQLKQQPSECSLSYCISLYNPPQEKL